jgi:hypothetical protein
MYDNLHFLESSLYITSSVGLSLSRNSQVSSSSEQTQATAERPCSESYCQRSPRSRLRYSHGDRSNMVQKMSPQFYPLSSKKTLGLAAQLDFESGTCCSTENFGPDVFVSTISSAVISSQLLGIVMSTACLEPLTNFYNR